MATAKELYAYLNLSIPQTLSCKWDNDGAMCMSDPDREIQKVLVTLDVTVDAVEYAVKEGFDAIISHHPLIFSPMRSINGCDVKSRIITKLMRNGVSAFSFHTRLDAVDGGVNDCLCSVLGFENAEAFTVEGLPLGRVVDIEPITAKELAAAVKSKLAADDVSFTCGEKVVKKLVVVGGAGKDMIDLALDSFADALLTGEVSYNAAIDASDSGLALIMAGHFFTENPVLSFLSSIIGSFDPSIITETYHSNLINHI